MKVTSAAAKIKEIVDRWPAASDKTTAVWGIVLKRCPFCGGNPVLSRCRRERWEHWWQLSCCISMEGSQRKALAEKWNRRSMDGEDDMERVYVAARRIQLSVASQMERECRERDEMWEALMGGKEPQTNETPEGA